MNAAEKKPWMDKLKVLHKLASESESSARIFKAIADPPTTSLQRLKVCIADNNSYSILIHCEEWLNVMEQNVDYDQSATFQYFWIF